MKLLLVEDDPEICGMLKKFLEKENFEIITANDGEEACSKFRQETCDLVLLDLMLPKISGMDVLQQIRAQSTVPIIIMSAKDTDSDITLGLGLGADDYVTTPFSPLELVARVNSQMRRYTKLGNAAESSKVFQSGGLAINDDLKSVSVDGEAVRLTPIEYNILLLLVKNQGKVFSINQIYENIWNEEAIGADNTVAVHICHIREKIEINPKEPQYLKVVWGVGYKIEKIEPR